MNLYSRLIFPRLLDRVMADPQLDPYRQQVLADVQGQVLEIGFGTGLNLPFYPSQVSTLAIVDPHPGMAAIAQKRIQAAPLTVTSYILSGEELPMAAATYDSVVSTWTLCSIPNVEAAIAEVHRVLKPGGRFFFIEHGQSDDPAVQVWQNRLNPVQKILGDGCHLNRDIEALIRSHFPAITLTRFYMDSLPKFMGFTYQGVATKAALDQPR